MAKANAAPPVPPAPAPGAPPAPQSPADVVNEAQWVAIGRAIHALKELKDTVMVLVGNQQAQQVALKTGDPEVSNLLDEIERDIEKLPF